MPINPASSLLRFVRTWTRSQPQGTSLKNTSRSANTFWQTPFFNTTIKMSSLGGASIGAGLYAVVSNPAQVGSAPEEAKDKRHHLKNGKGFQNPWDSHAELGFWQLVVKGLFWRKVSGQGNKPDTTPPTVPVQKTNLHPSRETSKLRATWLGHACFYVEFPSGLRALFDPVFEDCCAPVQLSGLRRYTSPPCEIEDLPFVDVVVISHNHYDHLSYPTIQRIQKKFPEAHFFAPLGNRQWFISSGVKKEKVTELDWWETRDVRLESTKQAPEKTGSVSVSSTDGGNVKGGISATIGALPCQHASARGPFDKFKTLWASWSIESGGAKVYFAGDTGYRTVPPNIPSAADLAADPTIDDYASKFSHLPTCPAFSQIGAHRGPFDLGLIPIGAYEPRFLFSNVHANPKDAVNIFVDTKCKRALGMHWGTWVLTEEEVMEPPQRLREALEWKGVEEGKFEVCDIGESREYETGP